MTEGKRTRKAVTDLGVASYARMNGFKVVGRKGKNIYFELNSKELEEFDKVCFEYLSSPFHTFDSTLFTLKKMPEYLPEE
jgi:regulator of sigma D